MNSIFSDRITDVPRSFIREILKATLDPSIISFAGGLPNKDLFPIDNLKLATARVFETFGTDALQYSNSEGFTGLRELISQRYLQKSDLHIPVEDILITNGSQQAIDLLGKVFINEGDHVIIEEPGYLGAIQAFSIFRPQFYTVPLNEEGMDIETLKSIMSSFKPKFVYTIPNFQNPSGISYSETNRRNIAGILENTSTLLIEDDPYGDLRYLGNLIPSFKTILPENTILLGSFSKTIAPGFRIGWIAASREIMDKLLIAKQASDLHTSHFTQCILYQYLIDNDIDTHIHKIREAYRKNMRTMSECIEEYFPEDVWRTHPQGGMFLWAGLPDGMSSRKLLDFAIQDKVIFVPGDPFYIDKFETNTFRLNFSCSDEVAIRKGIVRLGKAIKLMQQE